MPIIGAATAGGLALSALAYMHWGVGVWLVAVAAACVIAMMGFWWRDVIREAVYEGHHTPAVQIGRRYGMAPFIASEVTSFAAFFWAFFNASLLPTGPICAGAP